MVERTVMEGQGYVPVPDPYSQKSSTNEAIKNLTPASKTNEEATVTANLNEEAKKKLMDQLEAAAMFWASQPGDTPDLMNRIIKFLIEMIKTLQQVTIAQANQLTILTKTSNSYVLLQQNIPTILKGSSIGIFNGDDDKNSQARSNANNVLSMYMESIRANKGIQEDSAKKVQTQLNTSKEGTTQLTDLLTSLLDDIRTMTSTLFR